MYICITGATYIHTKNKAGDDRLQHHGSGKTSVIDIHGHGPYLGCGLSSPPATPPASKLQCWPAGGRSGGGGGGACHGYWGKVGQWQQEEQGSLRPGVPIIISHTIDPCLRRNKGYLYSPSHPQLSLEPRFLPGGGPTSCANGVRHSGMCREPGKAGSAHRGWDGEEGTHTDIRRGGWEKGLVGGGKGWESAGVLGSCWGRGAGRDWDRWS